MKRTLKGMSAYSTILSCALPEKTETYTPISHANVINRIRSEITSAGYMITGEEYRCSNDGEVAIGIFRMKYKEDPDIELSANFLNSYNKQYAFRFSLGGLVKVCMNGMMISNNKFGAYKRVHKGDADILAEGKISDFITDSEEYWSALVAHKDEMKHVIIGDITQNHILGRLFFEKEILNTMQLNMIKKELKKPSFDYKVDEGSAWELYNHITLALKESHPATWMQHQGAVHEVFSEELALSNFDDEADETPEVEEAELPAGTVADIADDGEPLSGL